MAYNIGVANFVRTWFSAWQWSDLPLTHNYDNVHFKALLFYYTKMRSNTHD